MTDQMDQTPDESASPHAQPIAALTAEINRMIEFVGQFGIGEPNFTGVRLEALIKTLVQMGVMTEEQYHDLNLRYAVAAHRQMMEIVEQVQAAAEEQQQQQVRDTLTRGVPGVAQSVNGQERRPRKR